MLNKDDELMALRHARILSDPSSINCPDKGIDYVSQCSFLFPRHIFHFDRRILELLFFESRRGRRFRASFSRYQHDALDGDSNRASLVYQEQRKAGSAELSQPFHPAQP